MAQPHVARSARYTVSFSSARRPNIEIGPPGAFLPPPPASQPIRPPPLARLAPRLKAAALPNWSPPGSTPPPPKPPPTKPLRRRPAPPAAPRHASIPTASSANAMPPAATTAALSMASVALWRSAQHAAASVSAARLRSAAAEKWSTAANSDTSEPWAALQCDFHSAYVTCSSCGRGEGARRGVCAVGGRVWCRTGWACLLHDKRLGHEGKERACLLPEKQSGRKGRGSTDSPRSRVCVLPAQLMAARFM
eukprot:363435-Chlamydomonas_euryale.AAC.5